MKVQVRGYNYTGHNFRGLTCAYDGRTVDVALVGTEQQIVKFVLDNFDWGGSAERFPTVADLCGALGNDYRLNSEGDMSSCDEDADEDEVDADGNPLHLQLGQFDGAGGVVWIKDENGEELFEIGDPENFADKVIDIGAFDLDKVDEFAAKNGLTGYTDLVNHYVREAVEGKAE